MPNEEFDTKFENDELYEEYAEYLMENSNLPIPNGDTLTGLMEDNYMLDSFKAFYVWYH